MGVWNGAKGAAGFAERGIVGLTKYLVSGAGSLLAQAATAMTGQEIGAAALASAGGVIAVSAVIAGGIGYMISRAMDSVASKMTADQQNTFFQGIGGGGPAFGNNVFGSNVTKPVSPWGKLGDAIHNHFYVDSQEVATKLIPPKGTGPTGFNPSAAPYSPGMGMY
jgi:hypothetical protein